MATSRSKPLSFTSVKLGPEPPRPVPAEPAPSPAVVTAPAAVVAPASSISRIAPPPARAPAPAREPETNHRGLYGLALALSLIWIGVVAAYAGGYETHGGRLALDPVETAMLVILAAAPAVFLWTGAYAVVQGLRLAEESRRAGRLTEALIGPAALAAAEAGALANTLQDQIAAAARAAEDARARLTALRAGLAEDSERLTEAAENASRTAAHLTEALGKERTDLNALALNLDARSAAVIDSINRQAQMVAEASDLAEAQLREAEAALAARAADLAVAAGEALDASRAAADDLGRQIARLETAGAGVGDQARVLEEGLTQQRAALVTVAHTLRAEQEDFATLVESRTAQLAAFVDQARTDVTALNEATQGGAQSLSALIGEARAKLADLAHAAGSEREAFAQSAEETLKGLAEAGARERDQLEAAVRSTTEALTAAASEAREAAHVHAEAAKARVDLLNEAAFAAGQKADQVFESRLAEAQGLIEQSVRLVEEAGDRSAAKLADQASAARELRATVEEGLEELLVAARRAAAETQAIDEAFQERVRRNYEMLSEAVQLMGVVASGGQGASVLQRPSPAERAKSRIAAASVAAETPADPKLRGRLKLTPTTGEASPAIPPAPVTSGSSAEESGWTWKDLLTSLEGEATSADAGLGEGLFTDIETMGIDPAALLPKGRIDEIAAAIQGGDAQEARELVRTLAPAAIRRLSRRLLADAEFRARSQGMVRRYGEALARPLQANDDDALGASLLDSRVGRAYLLLDAAAGQAS